MTYPATSKGSMDVTPVRANLIRWGLKDENGNKYDCEQLQKMERRLVWCVARPQTSTMASSAKIEKIKKVYFVSSH